MDAKDKFVIEVIQEGRYAYIDTSGINYSISCDRDSGAGKMDEEIVGEEYWTGRGTAVGFGAFFPSMPLKQDAGFSMRINDMENFNNFDIASLNHEKVYMIDGVSTILKHVRGNVAKAQIVNFDLTTTPCYVVKENGVFAHGRNLREAVEALKEKLYELAPVEERVDKFVQAHEYNTTYPNSDFYSWHHRLTGSCKAGRETFAFNHNIDIENGSMTTKEFIDLTINEYGSKVIKEVKKRYEVESS